MSAQAERLNGWAVMVVPITALGVYLTTGQLISGISKWN